MPPRVRVKIGCETLRPCPAMPGVEVTHETRCPSVWLCGWLLGGSPVCHVRAWRSGCARGNDGVCRDADSRRSHGDHPDARLRYLRGRADLLVARHDIGMPVRLPFSGSSNAEAAATCKSDQLPGLSNQPLGILVHQPSQLAERPRTLELPRNCKGLASGQDWNASHHLIRHVLSPRRACGSSDGPRSTGHRD
jgi:hypothetical protein